MVNKIMIKTLKKVVKKALNACRFEIHRKGWVRLNMAETLEHLKRLGFRPETVIDLSVANGTFKLYKDFQMQSIF